MILIEKEYEEYDADTGLPKGPILYYNIIIDKGDTGELSLELKNGDEPYVPQGSDEVYFAVARTWGVKPVLTKQLTSVSGTNIMNLVLNSEDTEDLAIRPYVYDIELCSNNNVCTVCKGRFTLGGEVNSLKYRQ